MMMMMMMMMMLVLVLIKPVMRRRQQRDTSSVRCGPQTVHLQVVNPFLRSINKLEQKAMFHTPDIRAGQRAQRRKMMQMMGVSPDWMTDDDVLKKAAAVRTRRAAVKPFAQDERFAEPRMYFT